MNECVRNSARANDATPVESQHAIVLLSKSAFAAAPIADMARLAALMQQRGVAPVVTFAFSEQGDPSILETLRTLRRPAISSILIIPLILPMEPSFGTWLKRSLARWQKDRPDTWPEIRVGASLGESLLLPELLEQLVGMSHEKSIPPSFF